MTDVRERRGTARFSARLGRAMRDALLNRTSEEYLSHLTGGESYWDEAVRSFSAIQASDCGTPLEYSESAQPPSGSPQ